MKIAIGIVVGASMLAITVGPVGAQTYDSGSTGVDGAFTLPNATCPTSPNCTLTLPASGEYNFTTVNIPQGWTLRFNKNTSNTPVVIRASGNVTIIGTIDVSGANGGSSAQNATFLGPNGAAGGPGGFSGGTGASGIVSTMGGAGGGPGGGAGGDVNGSAGLGGGGAGFFLSGANAPSGGGVGGGVYGTAQLLPIVGGSGGGAGGTTFGNTGGGGGGGGGALVISSSGTITFGQPSGSGTILAKGGNGGANNIAPPGIGGGGGGSGGAVRLAATTITSAVNGSGVINVSGGTAPTGTGGAGAGARGRIRIESYTNTAQVSLVGATPSVVLQPRPVVLPNTPTLRITAVGGVSTPTTPAASFGIPDVVLPATTTNPVQISLAAAQVPLGTTVIVSVKALTGAGSSTLSGGLAGTVASSTATASVTLPTNQPSIITASATFDLVASSGQGPFYAEGERVERVRIAASLGGATRVTYITASGREIAAALLQ